VIVSPYARPDFVTSTVFDHTSILKLIEQKWNLPPLTRRDAAAEAPLDAVDLDAPPAFLTPPGLPAASLRWGDWESERTARSSLWRQRRTGFVRLRRER
jgi:phospholipase C